MPTLDEILQMNSQAADELTDIVGGEGEMTEAASEALAGVMDMPDIDEDEITMLTEAATQLGDEFPVWLDEYLMNKEGEEYQDYNEESLLDEDYSAEGLI